MAFKPKFIRTLWYTLLTSQAENGQLSISLLSRGIQIPKFESYKVVPILATFCSLFSRLLATLHDGEFFYCCGSGKISSAKLDAIKIPEFKTHENGQVQEHIDLLQSIVSGQPINDARRIAESTLTAILGRIAAYTGQQVRWSDLTTNAESPWFNLALSPSPADFEAGKAVAPKDDVWPVPGEA